MTKTYLFIAAGSYVALTVLGRPPGLPQIPLPELDLCPGSPGGRGENFVTTPNSYSAAERTSALVSWVSRSHFYLTWVVFVLSFGKKYPIFIYSIQHSEHTMM